jgi:uroporphyrin-III C-methyltransferase
VIQSEISTVDDGGQVVTVHLVGAGPGDPELLTIRALRRLEMADVVVHDRLAEPVLALVPDRVPRIDVGKGAGHGRTQDEINRILVELGQLGLDVVRLKGGDPFVFGRGAEEVLALAEAGVPWEVVPGVTSAVGVPTAAGIPLTHRGVAGSFTVVAATLTEGRHPDWDALARLGGTLVVLMGAARRGVVAGALLAAGMPGATPVAAVTNGTTGDEVVVRTTLAGLGAAPVEAPATLVIGAAAGIVLPVVRPLGARART